MQHDAFAARSKRLVDLLSNDSRLAEGIGLGVSVQSGILRMGGTPGCQVFVTFGGWKRGERHLLRTEGTVAAEISLLFRVWFTTGQVPGGGPDLETQTLYLTANLYRVLMDHSSDPLWELLELGTSPVDVRPQNNAVWRCGY